ncbi:DUF2977 domain-containing protein [Staphylococcus rostri]|uniref:DUF2977 domain-containing protein n=1 Tax=Staphylococcus rostri TaxID=522262 RepID=A0A2K3YWD2_9STAP|nr:DUF2977 domain-containing protein [Staphylococcus rostri]PNZ29915.1 hypothetical protein CD122_01200 [Staphylococcus rostri]
MKIEVVDNVILSYAIVGDVDNSIEVDDELLPADFIESFEPKKFKYENEQVIINDEFDEYDYYSDDMAFYKVPDNDMTVGHDDELRKMFANMQVQLVQANVMIAQLSKQQASLTEQLVLINKENEMLKGEQTNENVVS